LPPEAVLLATPADSFRSGIHPSYKKAPTVDVAFWLLGEHVGLNEMGNRLKGTRRQWQRLSKKWRKYFD
jgi:hypothetical protein